MLWKSPKRAGLLLEFHAFDSTFSILYVFNLAMNVFQYENRRKLSHLHAIVKKGHLAIADIYEKLLHQLGRHMQKTVH